MYDMLRSLVGFPREILIIVLYLVPSLDGNKLGSRAQDFLKCPRESNMSHQVEPYSWV